MNSEDYIVFFNYIDRFGNVFASRDVISVNKGGQKAAERVVMDRYSNCTIKKVSKFVKSV